jgi:hypothetical protein
VCDACAKCHVSFYCSVICQRAAWTSHKQECIDPKRVLEMKKIAAQFDMDCAGGHVSFNVFQKSHDMLFSPGSYMISSKTHEPKAAVFFLRKQRGFLRLLQSIELSFNRHTSAPTSELNRFVTLSMNSHALPQPGTLVCEQARSTARHRTYIMEDRDLSRVVLEILGHSTLVTSIDGAAASSSVPTPTVTAKEETGTEAILVLSRLLESTFAEPSLHPVHYSVVASMELQAARHGMGGNVCKAVLRAAPGTAIDLTIVKDERAEDYFLVREFAQQALHKTGSYGVGARSYMCNGHER